MTTIKTASSPAEPAHNQASAEDIEPRWLGVPNGLPLINELCARLVEHRIAYCHWKSNAALHLSASGENDLDLLIDRGRADKFAEILSSLGFKAAVGPASRESCGIRHYFGYDCDADKFVHVHAHYQLVVGHDTTKNYRLPVEHAYIASSYQDRWFRVPQPEFELILFAVRMVLKHCVLDSLVFREARLSQTEAAELTYLTERSDPISLDRILKKHLPFLTPETFWRCHRAIEPGAAVWERIRTAGALLRALKSCGRHHRYVDGIIRVAKRLTWRAASVLYTQRSRKRFLNGGRLIAFIGGDGSGKSTAVAEAGKWLGSKFEVTTLHMGKPKPSLLTGMITTLFSFLGRCGIVSLDGPSPDEILAGRSAQPCGLAWVTSQVLVARDRWRQYRRALQLASNGRVVITDRFPLREIRCMDGIKAARVLKQGYGGWLMHRLVELERGYYEELASPDMLYVMYIDPAVAVRRRADENPRFVLVRNREIFEMSWAAHGVKRINSDMPMQQFLRHVKREIWQDL